MFLQITKAVYLAAFRIELPQRWKKKISDLSEATNSSMFNPLKIQEQYLLFPIAPKLEARGWANGSDLASEIDYQAIKNDSAI